MSLFTLRQQPHTFTDQFTKPTRRMRAQAKYADLNAVSPASDIDGSFVKSTEDKVWEVWVRVNLVHAIDNLSDSDLDDVYANHIRILDPLRGCDIHLEVLPVPVGFDERYARFRRFELDPTNPVRDDPAWQSMRHDRVADMAAWLQDANGDYESRAYLGIRLYGAKPDPSLSVDSFWQMSLEKRFYLEDPDNRWLIKPAAEVLNRLAPAWGEGVQPVSRDELDLILSLTNWPGQVDVQRPKRLAGIHEGERKELAFYGRSVYTDVAPGTLRFDRYGQKSYASFLPIARIPHIARFVAKQSKDYSFLTTSSGRRIRISWRFTYTSNKALIERARLSMVKAQHDAEYLDTHEGQASDRKNNIEIASTFYEYLRDGGYVLVGIPLVVITGDTLEEVEIERNSQMAMLGRDAELFIDPRYQMIFYELSRPGARLNCAAYVQYVSPQTFARGMPFVTSALSIQGPDLLGWVKGRELVPYTGALDLSTLLPGLNTAPVAIYSGNSGGGKTTTIINDLVAAIERGGYVGFLYELLKQDSRNLLGPDFNGIKVRYWELDSQPGLLNPAGLAPTPAQRVDLVSRFLRNCCGNQWNAEWLPDLRDAVKDALVEADKSGKPKPDLFRVLDFLIDPEKKYSNGRAIESILAELRGDTVVAPIFFSDHHDSDLIASMSQPGLNVIMQKNFDIPKNMTEDKYTVDNWLALAGLDLSTMLAHKVAFDKNVRTIIGTVEFHQSSSLPTTQSMVDGLARTGRSEKTVTAYDSQLWGDMPDSLREQATTKLGFQPEGEGEAKLLLKEMGLDADDLRNLRDVMNMANAKNAQSDELKGTAMVRLPNREVARVQGLRWYVGTTRTTDGPVPNNPQHVSEGDR